MSGVKWLVVGGALASLLASRNLRSEPRKVEKGPSTQPIDATSFVEGQSDKTWS